MIFIFIKYAATAAVVVLASEIASVAIGLGR
jgi:hypothetical protein